MRERALDHKCPGCGSPLTYKPKLEKWKCDHCNSEYDLETLQKYNNASSEENNKKEDKIDKKEENNKKEEKQVEDDTVYIEYHCKDCGAKIIADENTAATFCVYCGNTAILKSKLSGKFAPSKIIPFKKTKEEAVEAFKKLHEGRPLMPRFFNNEKNIEKIKGVYIPFWLFNIKATGKMNIKATKVKNWVVGNTAYTQTDTYSVDREGEFIYNRIPVDGSTRFDDDIMNTIEPFDYNKLVDYNHAYLSGFLAEKYDVESETASADAKKRADSTTRDTILNSVKGYTTKVVTSSNINNEIIDTEYVLLPVWMVNVKYADKFYTFAMNAQTGEFVGNIPVDKKRAFMYGAAIFLAIAALVIAVSYFMHLL